MNSHRQPVLSRRQFVRSATLAAAALSAARPTIGLAQTAGERPLRASDVTVLNPRGRVPVGWIIDDSTCLVNLNRFAMPQFAAVWGEDHVDYRKPWREWPAEIPDAFVRQFAVWCAEHGVKGKYSIVPYPACVGRVDRGLPGWTRQELAESLALVRSTVMPNWDIHPEMVTHTRVIDTQTGHPYREDSRAFMENWDWTTGRSADEIGNYMAYGLGILKEAGLYCEGITTPGGFGNQARPQLAQATFESVRAVFGVEIPHYFRDLFEEGDRSVAPLVQNATGLDGPDPRCVVHIIGCTGDWTGSWDCSLPEGADRFITADLQRGRLVDVIGRGEPAFMVAHWTGIYWNGRELGFQIFQEVVRRLQARYDHLRWMKLSEVARYWAARELTGITRGDRTLRFHAPFACPDFTVRFPAEVPSGRPIRLRIGTTVTELSEVTNPLRHEAATYHRAGAEIVACFPLPKGNSHLEWS